MALYAALKRMARYPLHFPLQDVVSVTSDSPRGSKALHGYQVHPKRELLDDVPRYLRQLLLGCT